MSRPARAAAVVLALALTTLAGAVAWRVAGGPAIPLPDRTPAASPPGPPSPAPERFVTLPPGARLPSSAQCATWVRETPLPESKRVNAPYDQATGYRIPGDFFDPRSTDPRANSRLASRIDGAFTGTTHEILRWAACKWGVDEDLVYAQAAQESWWRQTSLGDWHPDATACAPGHALGADGRPGMCPQSFGILQVRYPFQHRSWPGIATSTAMNADVAYAIWRACFEGYEHWLNDVEHGSRYAAGDAWGCVGRWVSGRWHTATADSYATAVRALDDRQVWQQQDFREL